MTGRRRGVEYHLVQQNDTVQIYAIREDGLATAPLGDNDFRDADTPNAAIRVDWASHQAYTEPRPELWDSDRYLLLASDRDPLYVGIDRPQALEAK
jgi:hypothetical protein